MATVCTCIETPRRHCSVHGATLERVLWPSTADEPSEREFRELLRETGQPETTPAAEISRKLNLDDLRLLLSVIGFVFGISASQIDGSLDRVAALLRIRR